MEQRKTRFCNVGRWTLICCALQPLGLCTQEWKGAKAALGGQGWTEFLAVAVKQMNIESRKQENRQLPLVVRMGPKRKTLSTSTCSLETTYRLRRDRERGTLHGRASALVLRERLLFKYTQG
jgi:hypothetical protein